MSVFSNILPDFQTNNQLGASNNINLYSRLPMEGGKKLSRLESVLSFPLASVLPSLTFSFLTLELVCDMP